MGHVRTSGKDAQKRKSGKVFCSEDESVLQHAESIKTRTLAITVKHMNAHARISDWVGRYITTDSAIMAYSTDNLQMPEIDIREGQNPGKGQIQI